MNFSEISGSSCLMIFFAGFSLMESILCRYSNELNTGFEVGNVPDINKPNFITIERLRNLPPIS
jgi:hypothetical protein